MKRIVKVTESNIRLGRKTWMNGTKCVIFRALRRTFKGKIEYCGFSYFRLKDTTHVMLPPVAMNMQRRLYKSDNAVIKPFSFTVNF